MTHLEIRNLLSPVSYAKGSKLPAREWGQLEEGHYVMVQREGEPILTGEVDARTKDGSVFWVWLDGGRGRIAVYADEGTRVWLPKGYRLEAEEEVAGAHSQTEAPGQPPA
ncbi:hypothetical protein [Arthrobacter sp. HMWF013]|uniref:hypothetical protein n=1 Tax=Arthrobacter sp. HMWF013 TaxID=2056849 RepID=UPI000D36643D|nr:hypothetical protein [Arthrobacter sp. HMWF013]PTT68773.1 hypothetical protein DBR22_05750 [Arthrobacter sp. HMWF013]